MEYIYILFIVFNEELVSSFITQVPCVTAYRNYYVVLYLHIRVSLYMYIFYCLLISFWPVLEIHVQNIIMHILIVTLVYIYLLNFSPSRTEFVTPQLSFGHIVSSLGGYRRKMTAVEFSICMFLHNISSVQCFVHNVCSNGIPF